MFFLDGLQAFCLLVQSFPRCDLSLIDVCRCLRDKDEVCVLSLSPSLHPPLFLPPGFFFADSGVFRQFYGLVLSFLLDSRPQLTSTFGRFFICAMLCFCPLPSSAWAILSSPPVFFLFFTCRASCPWYLSTTQKVSAYYLFLWRDIANREGGISLRVLLEGEY